MKGRDLALPIGQDFLAAGKALQDEVAVRRAVALAHDVLVRAEVLHPRDGLIEHLLFLV